ncbi:MAG: hypothetical protein Q3979_09710 [Actinomycetaceae bacterium]|nr:hypothetical protein [Actinomycetaceae bacterium]
MSYTPNGPWVNQGYQPQGGPSQGGPWAHQGYQGQGPVPPAPQSRKPLYFLIFAAAVLAVTLMAIFFIRILRTGQDAAGSGGDSSTSVSQSPSGSSTSPSSDDSPTTLDATRTAVKELASNPTCSSAEDHAATIINFAKQADSEGDFNDEKSTMSDAMNKLSEECGADYTLELTDELSGSGAPDKLASLAKDRDWWHLASPAPDNARELTEFTTARSNIHCKFSDGEVACSIFAYDYVSPDGCEGKTATYTLGLADDVNADCASENRSSVSIEYGTPVVHDGIWCEADQTQGVTCTSELSGKGFQLRRAQDRIF